jgi:hypothetical protein
VSLYFRAAAPLHARTVEVCLAMIRFVRPLHVTWPVVLLVLALSHATAEAQTTPPSIDTVTSADQATAASVTIPNVTTTGTNELLLAFVSSGGKSMTTVLSIVGGGLTWQLVQRANARTGTSEIWRAFAATPVNAPVTATLSSGVTSSMTVVAFSGVDSSGANGATAIGACASSSARRGAPSATITTTRANSWVFGVGNDPDNDVARTLAANQTLIHQYMPLVGDTYWVQRTSAQVAQAGTTVTIADTAPANDRYNLAICEIVGAASVDTAPPVISITAPAGGTIVSGTVTVSAAASDNLAVAGVQFMVDGAKLGVEVPSSPYAVAWNTIGVPDGAHTLTAIARDSAGNTATAPAVSVTVRNTDTTPPSISITAPAAGATVSGTAVALSANAADNIGVASVTFTIDGAAVGAPVTAAPYAISWNTTGVANGTHAVGAIARDAAGNQAAASTVSVTVNNASTGSCPCSLWSASTTPAGIETTDTQAIEVGVRFKADVDGSITGIRFYKGSGNTGTHVAHLWTTSGTLLATATFTGESASGWQQVQFSTPVATKANTFYIASYHTNVGQYAVDNAYFATTGVDNTPLHAPASVSTAPNGVYVYGATAFPTNSYQASNYWVDVTFTPGAPVGTVPPPPADTTPPTVSITAPAGGATVSGTTAAISATASDNVGVVGVQFKVDGSNVGAEVTTSPYTTSWNTTAFVNGTHTLTVVARDAAGNTTTSQAVTVTVNNVSATTTVVFQESSVTLVTSYLLEVFIAGSDPNTAVPVASTNLGKPTPAANGDISVDETTFFSALGPGTFVVTVSAVGPSGSARSAPLTVTF